MTLTLINPSGVVSGMYSRFADAAVPGMLGLITTKLVKAALGTAIDRFAPASIQQALGTVAGSVAGGFMAVFGSEYLANMLPYTRERSGAFIAGAMIEAVMPAWRYVHAQLPDGAIKNAIGAYYLRPMGGEYATAMQRLNGYAPGDMGDDASPNFSALAGQGVEPDYDEPGEFATALGVWQPRMAGAGRF